jgi:hypothetical protein
MRIKRVRGETVVKTKNFCILRVMIPISLIVLGALILFGLAAAVAISLSHKKK